MGEVADADEPNAERSSSGGQEYKRRTLLGLKVRTDFRGFEMQDVQEAPRKR